MQIELADGNSVRSDEADAEAVLSRFLGRDVKLARAAQSGYTIDQYHPDEENYDPEGHRDEVVEARFGAAFLQRTWAALRCPRGLVLRSLPAQRSHDVKPGPTR